MTDRPRYLLVVEVHPDRRLPPEVPDAPPAVTLRRALKQLWRCFRLKVLSAEEWPPRPHADGGAGVGDR
jgi:hypothetical protein